MTTTLTTEAPPRQTARVALDRLRATRQDAEMQARSLTEECAALRARRESLHLDARLGLAGAAAECADVEARLAAATAQLEDARRLAAEAARREPAACQALHTAAFAAAVTMLAEQEAEVAALVEQIRMERERAPADVCERVVLVARQAAGLAHDLHAVTDDSRFARRGDLRERLGPDTAPLVPGLQVRPYERKPPVERPWAGLLDDLAETST